MSFKALDLDDAFEQFMRKVNPSVMQHSAQYKESRRVWFAGCHVMLQHLAMLALYREEIGVAELERLNTQLEEFSKRVKDDRD